MKKLIIAVDGPSGAGKSTISKILAEKMGLVYIDTGAMYRAVALKSKEVSIDPENREALGTLARKVRIEFKRLKGKNHTFLDDNDVTEEIRLPEITMLTSAVSAVPSVRDAMVALQRKMAEKYSVIMDGRDIGTVVFPDADYKFFIDADLKVRGQRRYLELKEKGSQSVSEEDTLADIERRDKADMERSEAPLKKADDALYIDTTGFTPDEVVEKIKMLITEKPDNK